VAAYRHVVIGLGRKIKGFVIRQMEMEIGERQETENEIGKDPTTEERREGEKTEYIWDRQSTHGSAIAREYYALDMRFPNQFQAEMIAKSASCGINFDGTEGGENGERDGERDGE
jgi:hypothetical protein